MRTIFADYVSYILQLEQESRTDKFDAFRFDNVFPNCEFIDRFVRLRNWIQENKKNFNLDEKKDAFTSWVDADYWLFGLIYWIVFKNKSITSDKSLIDKISEFIPEAQIRQDEPMSKHSSFRIGGPADVVVTVCSEEELSNILSLLHSEDVRYMLIGNGSDLLFADEGYRGVIVKLGGDFEHIELLEEEDDVIRVGSARMLSSTANFARDNGLAGLEFASGIPGTLGGALFMNAGAYGGEMKDVVESVTLMKSDGSSVYELSGEEMKFSYRDSVLQHNDDIAIYARVRLHKDDKESISERMNDFTEKRRTKQPINFPSAGSTFKRPVGGYAAALIEDAGLKGRTVGGAQVSEKHSGFVINIGDATSKDVRGLIDIVAQEVEEHSGIKLEPEVRIIDAE